MKKKFRIVNPKRFIITSLTMITMIIAVVMMMIAISSGDKISITDYRMVVISDGDTLWSIASEINPGKDIRDVVYDIEEMNKWDGCPYIHSGDIISIPIYSVE